jgi:hypothetical protein
VPDFDAERAVAAWAYLVHCTAAPDDQRDALRYLADKLHLQRYGRLIAPELYLAQAQGPWANGVRQCLAEAPSLLPGLLADLPLRVIPALSLSDRACLDAIAARWHREPIESLRTESQDAAWRAAMQRSARPESWRPLSLVAIAATVDIDGTLVAHVRDPHPGHAPACP